MAILRKNEKANKSDTKRSLQHRKNTRSLKFYNRTEKKLYYLCSENKDADQLCSHYNRWFHFQIKGVSLITLFSDILISDCIDFLLGLRALHTRSCNIENPGVICGLYDIYA